MRIALVLFLSGCSAYDQCRAVSASDLSVLPARLSETGLSDPSVRPYAPAFQLWSDGAEKRRWVWLPPGTVIDSRDEDDWQFPEGTRFWKEFTRDGVKVETRLLLKVASAWVGASYVWNGDDAELTPAGAVNVLGTEHDVPAADRCMGCHAGRKSGVLGFSAVQLANSTGPLRLQDLVREGLLSDAPLESFVLPGTEEEQRVLGMLHANCAHCHNQTRPAPGVSRCFDPENDIDLALNVATLGDFSQTGLARTVIGQDVTRGDAANSKLFQLFTHRGTGTVGGPTQMPPLATEKVDEAGAAVLKQWIDGLR